MNNKTVTFVAFAAAIALMGYLAYNSFNQLKDIEYDLLNMEEDYEDDLN